MLILYGEDKLVMENKGVLYSVIVPVYNAEFALDKTIQSVLAQSEVDFELILVDDGSTDRSLSICNAYAERDGRIIVVHKENGGVSSARNTGLRQAKGKYIVFVDSDDIVAPDLLYTMRDSDADLVMVGFDDYDSEGKVTSSYKEKCERYTINDDESINHFLNSRYSVFIWGKRYKRDIIKNTIRFNERHMFSEDILFNNEYILHTNDVEIIDKVGYHHCHYQFETLSSVTGKYPLIRRTSWQEAAFHQYEGHPKIQERLGKQYLYFCEKEFTNIATAQMNYREKRRMVKDIITHPFFKECIEKYPKQFTAEILLYLKCKACFLLLARYRDISLK